MVGRRVFLGSASHGLDNVGGNPYNVTGYIMNSPPGVLRGVASLLPAFATRKALPMGTTIREVARHAGVSVATVSRALNGSGQVRAPTRERVLRAARQLRYVPNGSARSLTTSETRTLGVLLPDLYGEFFSELLRGIDQTARQSRYHTLVSSSHNDVGELEAALRAMSGRVDGLVVMTPALEADLLEANLPAALPVVLVNCPVEGSAFSTIATDNHGGAFAMVEHLRAQGHERVALLRGPEGNHDALERLRGYRDALRGAEPIEEAGDFTERSGYEAAQRLLARAPRPTAVFAANDSMAIGALRALREAGLRVPGDVAVAGFDDIPVARYVSPPLSSVHVAINEMGRRAIELLLASIAEPDREPEAIVLPTRLVLRESSAAAPVP